MPQLTIVPVTSKAERGKFVDFVYTSNATDPHFVPQLRAEELEKYTPGGNPYFEHARCQLYLACADSKGKVVGRIAAHIDELAIAQPTAQGMGPGCGFWGALEADDETIAAELIGTAESWLRREGMTRVIAPMNLSVWEEPGLLTRGHDHPPMVMMGHHARKYQAWIEARGYRPVKTLYTYDLDITKPFPPLIQRIIAAGNRNSRITERGVDLKKFDQEAAIILDILNDAWSSNWGFVPITDNEIAYTARKLKPLVKADLVRIAELDGVPVAFIMTLPDLNRMQKRACGKNGKPSVLGWIKLGWWLFRTRPADVRVPLMGVRKSLQASRLASQLTFVVIENVRRASVERYNGKRAEIGWVLDDNQGMNSVAREIGAEINKEYLIYARVL